MHHIILYYTNTAWRDRQGNLPAFKWCWRGRANEKRKGKRGIKGLVDFPTKSQKLSQKLAPTIKRYIVLTKGRQRLWILTVRFCLIN